MSGGCLAIQTNQQFLACLKIFAQMMLDYVKHPGALAKQQSTMFAVNDFIYQFPQTLQLARSGTSSRSTVAVTSVQVGVIADIS
jgi:hypothetical protein